MSALLRFLNRPALERAMELSSFDRLKALEMAKGLPGRDYDRSNPPTLRMRKGQAGGFRTELTPEQQRRVESALAAGPNGDAAAMLAPYALGASSAPPAHPVAASVPRPAVDPRRSPAGAQRLAEALVVLGLAAVLIAPVLLGAWALGLGPFGSGPAGLAVGGLAALALLGGVGLGDWGVQGVRRRSRLALRERAA